MMTRFALAIVALLAPPTVQAQEMSTHGSAKCDEFQSTVQLSDRMTMSYVVTLDDEDETNNGQMAVQLVCECQGWVGFAVTEDQAMPNSDAILGFPEENEVAKFRIGGARFISPDDRRSEIAQTLSNASIRSNDTHTVLEFTKRLKERNEIPIDGTGSNNFLWAFGSEFAFGPHLGTDRGVFSLALSPCVEGQGVAGGDGGGITAIDSETFQAQWSTHGLFASVAWGILAPCAIGSSLLRDFIPGQGMWFRIHMVLNSTVLLFTIIAFSLAVNAINNAGGEPQHFRGVTHRSVGLAIFLLVIIQVFGGLFRPHAPSHKGSGGKRPIRLAWEVLHKGSGFGLLILSWWEVQEGIGLYYMRFGGTDYRPVFWGITGCIAGIVLVLWAYGQVCGTRKAYDKESDKDENEFVFADEPRADINLHVRKQED